ncbi:TonB-dependent receptor [Aliikangiella maris]|uniref:TonB-dependent receptor n=2 Tax=Aliikangiella maris TaxID=3162458 RepID=A0ABV3MNA2_9GAMM
MLGGKSIRVNAVVAALALALSTSVLAESEIVGKVSDKSERIYFQGALIKIKELDLTQVSQRDGSFRFKNIPSGLYTLVIHYLGAKEAEYQINLGKDSVIRDIYSIEPVDNGLEEVIVLGQSASQASALNRQKNAHQIKTIVSSDAVGEFPDQNIAESLQRLPGMFIQRDQGEGRFVGIRGIDPNLNNLTINGSHIPSPESGVRSVAMDVIPSELIGSLEVSKTVSPDMDADAVGGSIEVKSLSAFDRQEGGYSITVQNSYNELVDENSPKISASYSDIVDLSNGHRIGIATAISYFERKFGSFNIETDGGWGEFEFEDVNSGDDVSGFATEEIEQRNYQIVRERLGLALNLDYRIDDNSYYLRILQSEFSDDEYRLRNEYKFDKGLIEPETWNAVTANFFDAEMDRDTKDRFEEQTITSIVAGGLNSWHNWLIEYSFGYSKSSEKEPDRLDVAFAGESLSLVYQADGAIPKLAQSDNAHDLSVFEMDEIEWVNNLTEDKETSFKIDFSHDFVWNNFNSQFKFGTKLRRREKFNHADITIYDGGFGNVNAADFSANTPVWNLGKFGPGLDRRKLKQWFIDVQDGLDVNTLDSQIDSQGSSFISEEDINAAYVMLTMDIGQWNLVSGLRYEKTQFSTTGNKVELAINEVTDEETVSVNPWQVNKDYDYLLPSINATYQFNDKWLTRFAYSQTIARSTFADSAAYQLIESETVAEEGSVVTERKAEAGNPQLKPYESTNFDWAVEYYPGQIGLLSAGVFYKSIDNYIILAEVQSDEPNNPWSGYEEVVQPINGGKVDIQGFEFSWVKNFQSGLLISANATLTDADNEIPNQADTVANLVVGYETNQFSSRITLTHKNKAYQFDDNDLSVYEDKHNQVDLSVKYFLNDKSHIYLNAINLTDEPFYLYHTERLYNYQYEEYGRSYEVGFTWRSF